MALHPTIDKESVKAVKKSLNEWLFGEANGTVMGGPFVGMKLLKDKGWEDGNLGTQILGCYELELQGDIEREITRLSKLPNPKIVNVGCADGYYAIGMALRLPHAFVLGTDISDESLAIARRAAELNGVTNCAFGGGSDQPFDLVIMDVEGYEEDYLRPDDYPWLRDATIIVECHNQGEQERTNLLKDRFALTHKITPIHEGARNPNIYGILRGHHSLDRWAAISEGRPCSMDWLVMRPIAKTDKVCGECNLCCKLEMVPEIKKPANEWCGNCDRGIGCKTYYSRPRSCFEFQCLWLTSPDMPDHLRPDRIGMYAIAGEGCAKIVVDTAKDSCLKWLVPRNLGWLRQYIPGHALVMTGRQVEFLPGDGLPVPEKIILDWTL